ncbi:MAG: wax ester/triacylglycerol synthase domain-containing protein [Aggregatilineales bacterium]
MDRHMHMLGPVDTAFWQLDNYRTPMNLGGILILGGEIDFEKLIELIDSRLHMAPAYKQKVVNAPMNLGEPTWAFDPSFDVRNHMFQLELDNPGNDIQLRKLCGELVSGMLDRDKPLWELYQINGLADGKTAILFKVHHCMVDGISAVELFALMMDFTSDVSEPRRKPIYHPPPLPTKTQLLQESVVKAVPHRWNILKKVGTEALDIGMGMLDRNQRKKTLMGVVSVINDNLTPIKKLAISGKNSGDIRLAWVDFPLQEIRAIKKVRRASVNDVVLTLIATAIGKYQESHGEETGQDFVRIVIPVNMRSEGVEEMEGNRISVLPIEIPIYGDILERLSAVQEYTSVMKDANLSSVIDMALSFPSLIPAVTQPALWGVAPMIFGLLAHTWCTNVPGPQIPLYLLGQPLEQAMGFFPNNPSMGLATVVLSYNQRVTMNLMGDANIIEDIDVIRDHLQAAYEELRDAAGVKPSEPAAAIKPEPEPVAIEKRTESAAITAAEAPAPPKEKPVVKAKKAAKETEKADDTPPEKPKLMSQGWADNLHEEINNSRAYYDASKRWTAGALGMIMTASPQHGFDEDTGVYLDLLRGKCKEATSMPARDLKGKADFVLEGDYDSWMEVLEGRSQALPMIMRGKIRLSKGAMRKLMPFTKSAQELVNCAMRVT